MPERIARYCLSHMDLQHAKLSDEYFYQSLPFCIIDAVYSLASNYTSTRNTVIRFCRYQNLERLRPLNSPYPANKYQYSVQEFEALLSSYSDNEKIAIEMFDNRQRTSTRNGILKAEAVHRFAKVLLQHKVNYFEDMQAVVASKELERDICGIPGQTYGTSLTYFFMLAGDENMIKPDRMIWDFLFRVIPTDEIGQRRLESWYTEALHIIQKTYPELTLRQLDHEIWKYERSRP